MPRQQAGTIAGKLVLVLSVVSNFWIYTYPGLDRLSMTFCNRLVRTTRKLHLPRVEASR